MKKLTAMLTTVALLAGFTCQSAFAAFGDVAENNRYKKAITTLSKLSVIDGYEENGQQLFKPENSVTRAEFTKLIVFILGMQDQTYSSYTFGDVSTDHWARNYIQTGYNLGIIAGFDDGTFRPEEPVTYEQALKMVDCTLGYDSLAQSLGGWPEGYKQQAAMLGLDKNVTGIAFYEGAPRGVIAQVLYNALEVNMYENNGYSWIKTDKTLLNDYLQVKELKGTLVGVEDAVTEECTRSLLEGEMDVMSNSGEEYVITYTTMTENVADIKKYLGNTITVYYRQKSVNDQRMLVIIDDETNKNNVYDLTYDDINSLSGTTLKYFDSSSKTKTVKLKAEDLTVRYNGKIVAANTEVEITNKSDNTKQYVSRDKALEMWLNPGTDYSIYGTVKLTDSSNNGTVDMVQIYDYKTIVAYAAPSTSDYRVTDKLVTGGDSLMLDPQAANYTYTITKNNAEIPATSIAANDVILYATSIDETTLTLLVSNTTVKGTISSINSDGTEITINNEKHKLSEQCVSYVKEKSGKEIKVGVSGTFYLDALGTAVFATIDQTAVSPYAYIANAFLETKQDDKAYVTVYSTNISGSAASYPVKDRVKFNGSTIDGSLVVDKLAESARYANHDEDLATQIYGAGKTVQTTPYSQPARVTIKDGVITEIVTLEADESEAQNENKEKLVRCKELDQYKYSTSGFTLDGKTAFTVNSSTIVLCPPSDRNQKSKYAKKTPSAAFTTGDMYYVEAYDINSSKAAGLVILYGSDGSLTKPKRDTDFSIVSKAPEMTYDEGSDKSVFNISVFAGTASAEKNWATYDDKEFSNVQPGDVIQFSYDSDQYIQGLVSCISYSDIADVLNSSDFDWQETQTPSAANNYQSYKFDYRFKKANSAEDEEYTSTSIGTVPYSRACMYNVSQVLVDEKKLYVTRNGFGANSELDDSDYEEIDIQSSTKIVRYDKNEKEVSPYVLDTTTNMTINDLRDAKNYGINCSKILVCTSRNVAKLIVVYQ